MTIDSWLAADEGDASGFWMVSFIANLVFPETQVWGDVAAMSRADATAVRRFFAGPGDDAPGPAGAATRFLFARGGIVDAWPANADDDAYSEIPVSNTETLMINGALDLATPPTNVEELMPKLRNGHEVVLDEVGHTTSVWAHQPAANKRLITTFLDSGRVDTSAYRPAKLDLHPEATHGALAKRIVAVMIGLPLLVALALAGIAQRVRRRNRLSSWSSALIRTLLATVAGLAGWMAGVLIVLATSARIAVDDQSLVLVAVALPVAAATYYGWSDLRRARRSRRTGLAAAVAGSVIGAWLGFGAGEDFLALAAAIFGAVAGANLALIARDIWAGDDAPPRPGPAGSRRDPARARPA